MLMLRVLCLRLIRAFLPWQCRVIDGHEVRNRPDYVACIQCGYVYYKEDR